MHLSQLFQAIFLFSVFSCSFAKTSEFLYIGSGGADGDGGIFVAAFSKGSLSDPHKVFDLPGNSSLALTANKKTLYVSPAAARGKDSGESIALAALPDGGLRELNRLPIEADHFCSMAISKDGSKLLGASFGTGVVASFRLNDNGSIRDQISNFLLPRFPRGRKDIARAHDVEFNHDESLAFVPDIANNRVYTFDVHPETGALKQRSFIISDSFLGPRHLIANSDTSVIYVLNQKGSSVVAFRHDGRGKLTEFQSIPTIPADYSGPQNHSAEVLLHPNGRFLYTSNRGHDSLTVFQVGDDGRLKKVQSISSGGQSPWSFVLTEDGSYLICSNRTSNNLVVFRIDQETGLLERLGSETEVADPVSLAL